MIARAIGSLVNGRELKIEHTPPERTLLLFGGQRRGDGGPSPLCRSKSEVDVVHDLLQTPWGVRVSGRGREVWVVGTPRVTLD